jgi:hypothetical protein
MGIFIPIVALAELRSGARNPPGYFVTARELAPVLLETKKILANIRASGIFCLAGAVGGMRAALFNFFAKRERHRSAFLSEFDPQTCEHGAGEPLRISFRGGATEFDHAVGEHFAHAVRIVRAVQHPEHRVKSVAQELGTGIVENAADNGHSATPAACHFYRV